MVTLQHRHRGVDFLNRPAVAIRSTTALQVLSGEAVVTYADGSEETCSGGDLVHWPPGHTVRVVTDADVVRFSPMVEHAHVLEHMGAQMAAGSAAS